MHGKLFYFVSLPSLIHPLSLLIFCRYYKGISKVPAVSDQDMNTMLADFSSQHHTEFYTLTALNELYFCYAVKCKNEVSVFNLSLLIGLLGVLVFLIASFLDIVTLKRFVL